MCAPLAVETYGNWGKEARDIFSRLATRLAIGSPKSTSRCCVYEIYCRLYLTLIRSFVKAIMVRTLVSLSILSVGVYSMLMHIYYNKLPVYNTSI